MDGWMVRRERRREEGTDGGREHLKRVPVAVVIVVDLVLTLEHIPCHALHLWWGKHRFWNKMTIIF